jgi:uncharacterized protein (DUF885 family)
MSATDAILRLADDLLAHLRQTSAQTRHRSGAPVGHLDDLSFDAARREAAYCRDGLAALDGVALGELGHEEWLLARLLRHRLASGADAELDYWLTFAVTPYSGGWVIASVHDILRSQPVATAPGQAQLLALARDYAALLHQVADKTEQQAGRGIRVPRPAIPGVRATLAALRSTARELLTEAIPARAAGQPGSAAFAAELRALADSVLAPAYDRLQRIVDDRYAAAAPAEVGLGRFPDGAASYRRRIARAMGRPLDPAAIHQRGLADVEALGRRMREVRDAIGFRGSRDEFHAGLRADPRFLAQVPEDVERRYLACMARIGPLIPRYFSQLPKAPYAVRRVDPAAEAGMTFGYYQMPTAADPTGYYRYNGSNLASRPLVNAAHLIYHELVPGHHFHLALEFENARVHPLRKFLYYGAFAEGWAEYAAGLAEEMGLYDDPYDLYGHLASEIFVATRLVVDTGLNALGWTLEQAREFMREHVLEPDALIATETLRYSTDLYGQALDYRLGYHCFRDLRRHAESVLGDRFDLRRFHDAVIGSGGMPLEVLSEHVDWFVRSAAGAAA